MSPNIQTAVTERSLDDAMDLAINTHAVLIALQARVRELVELDLLSESGDGDVYAMDPAGSVSRPLQVAVSMLARLAYSLDGIRIGYVLALSRPADGTQEGGAA